MADGPYDLALRLCEKCGTRPIRDGLKFRGYCESCFEGKTNLSAADKPCARCGHGKRVWFPSQVSAYCASCLTEIRVESRRQFSYGVSTVEYEAMLIAQCGVCAVCGGMNDNGRPLFVDHDHETGAVRGLLCGGCNVALGMANDDPDTLRRLAEYVEDSRG